MVSAARYDESIIRGTSMIRLTYVLRRREDVAFADFQAYWLNEHGPKVQQVAAELNIRRYVQVHTLVEPESPTTDHLRGQMQKPFDGVAEFWFDSQESLLASTEKSRAIDAELIQDERNFIDHDHSAGWIAYDCPQINASPETVVATPDSSIVKLFYVLNYPQQANLDDAQWYWRVQHGPLVRQVGPEIQALRYIQVHRLAHDFNRAFAISRGTLNEYFGHAELWFDLDNQPKEGAQDASVLLYEDEAKFIDFSRSSVWYGKEHVLVDDAKG